MKIKNDVTKPTLYVIGISHKNADATIRGLFSLSPTNKRNILMQGKLEGVENLLINSTCNRTEIYATISDPSALIELLCNNSKGSAKILKAYGYVLVDEEAVKHIFRVF